jgi:toxin ParE1/3/4
MSARKLPVGLAPRARNDLRDIESYTLQEWGELQWEANEATLWQALESLGDNPYLGRARDDLRLGARALIVRQYVIVYLINDDMVMVARILHRSRDLRTALELEP